jgi:alkaline phosphatase
MYYEIDVDLANSGFDFFGGGGLKRPTGKNKDQPSALEMAKKNGYTIVDNRSDFMALRPGAGKVLAYNQVLDGSRALPYELDRAYNDVSIAEYTAKAIELLDNKKGFFIMVEGGKIDWACHANDAAASIRDTIAFDEAIAEAVDFYKEHPDDTLIVVTGDHECGGLTLGFAGTKYKTAFHLLKMQKKSATDYFAGVVLEEYKKSHTAANARLEDLAEEIRENFGLVYLSSAERDRLKQRAEAGDQAAALELEMALSDYEIEQVQEAFMESMREEKERSQNEETYLLYGGYEPLAVTLSHILNNKAGMAWTSYKHTGVPVPTFAMGVGQDMFNGYYDNTDVAKKMMKVMNVPQAVAAK